MLYSKRRKNLGGGLENAPTENLMGLKDFAVLKRGVVDGMALQALKR